MLIDQNALSHEKMWCAKNAITVYTSAGKCKNLTYKAALAAPTAMPVTKAGLVKCRKVASAMAVVQCPPHSNLSLIQQTSVLSFNPSANTSL